MRAKERLGGRKPTEQCIISVLNFKSGKQKCLKAKYRVIGHDWQDRAKKDK